MNIFNKLNRKQKLAVIAFLLGLIALFAGSPYESNSVKINVKEIALSTINDYDKIKPEILADWIIQGKSDFVLIDLRTPDEFEKYSLSEAENIPLVNLTDAELYKNQKLLLFSNDNVQSAQGWFLLKSRGFKNVYILDGGIEGWKTNVLFPKQKLNMSKEELALFEKKKAVAFYFGGKVLNENGISETNSEFNLPVQSSKPNKTSSVVTQKKKKREGC